MAEQIEDLQCHGLKIIQDKSLYTFTSDSVILANFIKIKANESALEIGAGCGVISILLSKKTHCKKFVAFEMQNALSQLAVRNVELNNLQEKISIINDKIQNYKKYIKNEEFDVIYSNPPYMKSNKNFKNKLSAREIARHDSELSLIELCDVCEKLLKFGGRLYVIYSSERSVELISQLIKHNLQPKVIFFTDNGRGEIQRVVIEAVKGGKSGVKVLPNLITNDQNGEFLEKLRTRNFI